jgi:hypothetical protein
MACRPEQSASESVCRLASITSAPPGPITKRLAARSNAYVPGTTIISYGGGVQSTAMLVLAIRGQLGYQIDAALFANVGDDSECTRHNRQPESTQRVGTGCG